MTHKKKTFLIFPLPVGKDSKKLETQIANMSNVEEIALSVNYLM